MEDLVVSEDYWRREIDGCEGHIGETDGLASSSTGGATSFRPGCRAQVGVEIRYRTLPVSPGE